MSRPRLLDLFCGVGGCSVGYHRAGFDVVGVDLVRRGDYPYELHIRDAVTYLVEHWAEFDAVHASPPCKAHTRANTLPRPTFGDPLFPSHLDFLGPILDALHAVTVPWVVENVPGAPLPGAVTYCGSSFGLQVRRHRLFVSNVSLSAPACDHKRQGRSVGVWGHGGGRVRGQVVARAASAATALGIDWTVEQAGLSQAIPPVYTEHIGRQLLAHLDGVDRMSDGSYPPRP